jgi:hypothetical protein
MEKFEGGLSDIGAINILGIQSKPYGVVTFFRERNVLETVNKPCYFEREPFVGLFYAVNKLLQGEDGEKEFRKRFGVDDIKKSYPIFETASPRRLLAMNAIYAYWDTHNPTWGEFLDKIEDFGEDLWENVSLKFSRWVTEGIYYPLEILDGDGDAMIGGHTTFNTRSLVKDTCAKINLQLGAPLDFFSLVRGFVLQDLMLESKEFTLGLFGWNFLKDLESNFQHYATMDPNLLGSVFMQCDHFSNQKWRNILETTFERCNTPHNVKLYRKAPADRKIVSMMYEFIWGIEAEAANFSFWDAESKTLQKERDVTREFKCSQELHVYKVSARLLLIANNNSDTEPIVAVPASPTPSDMINELRETPVSETIEEVTDYEKEPFCSLFYKISDEIEKEDGWMKFKKDFDFEPSNIRCRVYRNNNTKLNLGLNSFSPYLARKNPTWGAFFDKIKEIGWDSNIEESFYQWKIGQKKQKSITVYPHERRRLDRKSKD